MLSLHQHQALFPLLAEAMQQLLLGFKLKDAYRNMQSTELTLVFQKDLEELSLVLNIEAKTGLFFFYEYALERNGAVFPLFKEAINLPVLHVSAHANNRSFQCVFGSDQILVFKMYAALSNVLFYENGALKQLFRSSIENDRFIELNDFSQTHSQQELPQFKGYFFVSEQIEAGKVLFTFEPIDGYLKLKTESIFEALNEFSKRYLQAFLFSTAHQKLLSQYKQKLKREAGLVRGLEYFFKQAETAVPFEEIGHILMANLHLIPKGEKQITLFDFYRDTPISIDLKKDLSAADNASYYYQKAKNRKQELLLKNKQLSVAQIRLSEVEKTFAQIAEAVNLKALKPWIKEEKLKEQTPLKEKFRKFSLHDYLIYVGKNAKNNDELTLKFAHKDDLWLHAKGVSGSHVIIKHKAQMPFPAPVIAYAAQIAAHYSSAAGSFLVPVIYTFKKFVRKPKGANPGQVSVEKEELLVVEPRLN
ncbi:MAG: NFACT RNA binding domain-containing protein [bacterium]|nr:NFACT RNA binding domain-containing protein [bacterium]